MAKDGKPASVQLAGYMPVETPNGLVREPRERQMETEKLVELTMGRLEYLALHLSVSF